MQIVILETDQDVIGFEGLSDIETRHFLKYDESWIIADPSPHTYGFVPGMPLCDVTIQLSAKVLTQKRSNTKLIDILGYVGGLMEVVWSIFNILATVITDILYDKALINNLFTFDLDKKIVLIKNKKKKAEEYNASENLQIYNPNIPSTKIPIYGSNNYQDEYNLKSSNKLEENSNKRIPTENLLTVKKKKKKKIKPKDHLSSAISMKSIKNDMNSQNLEENVLRSPNEIDSVKDKKEDYKYNLDKTDRKENTEINNNENRRIIDRIKMNCCCIYFWFCFARKKNTIENALLDEGMRIIVENLDIMNIFKKIHSAELMEQTLKNSGKVIDMSDTTKQKIYSLYKSKYNS